MSWMFIFKRAAQKRWGTTAHTGGVDHTCYVEKLSGYFNEAPALQKYAWCLSVTAGVINNARWISNCLEAEHDKAVNATRGFLSSVAGVFCSERVKEICGVLVCQPTGLDGGEALFFLEEALLEVKRYFFRHTKRLAELMAKCEFRCVQINEPLLPLAKSVVCAWEAHSMPREILPETYRKLEINVKLPALQKFMEPDGNAPALEFVPGQIREGLTSPRPHQSFYKANEYFFSEFLADEAMFVKTRTTLPEEDEETKIALIDYLRKHCEKADIFPTVDSVELLNCWITAEQKEKLKGEMLNGYMEAVCAEEREDMPDWQTRFRVKAVTFGCWKENGGWVCLGKNIIMEYRNMTMLENAAADESDGEPVKEKFFALIKHIASLKESEEFEKYMAEDNRLLEFGGLVRYVSGRKAGGFLTEYFNLAAAPFLDRYAYKTLTPQIKVGEAYDGQIVYALPEPRGANDKEEPCLLEEIRAVAEIETASVRGVKPGLARSDVIIFHPVVIVETPVSVFDRLNELADRLESEKRADMEFLSGRVYLAQFINYSRKLEMFMRRENVDAERKLEWMNQNHFLYNFFNSEPETAFEKIAGALDSVSAEKYKAAFLRAWASDVQRLDSMGIRETIIVVGHTVVTHSQLLDGWKKENRERRKADADHPADLVYGIIRKGVEIEGAPVQSPIVNVYSN